MPAVFNCFAWVGEIFPQDCGKILSGLRSIPKCPQMMERDVLGLNVMKWDGLGWDKMEVFYKNSDNSPKNSKFFPRQRFIHCQENMPSWDDLA
jgi:hypothetical protein